MHTIFVPDKFDYSKLYVASYGEGTIYKFYGFPRQRGAGAFARINSNYLILLRNPQDKLGVATLFRQVFPSIAKAALEAFEDATSMPHGYLLLDLHQHTDDQRRMMSDIFSVHPIEYVAKR